MMKRFLCIVSGLMICCAANWVAPVAPPPAPDPTGLTGAQLRAAVSTWRAQESNYGKIAAGCRKLGRAAAGSLFAAPGFQDTWVYGIASCNSASGFAKMLADPTSAVWLDDIASKFPMGREVQP